MSIKEVISQGEAFEVEYLDRAEKGKRTSALKISGTGATPTIELGAPLSTLGVSTGVVNATDINATGTVTVGARVNATGLIHSDVNITAGGDISATGAITAASGTIGTAPILAGAPFLVTVAAGVAAAGPVAVAGVKIGDKVIGVTNLSDNADGNSSFEDTVTVADQIQQTNVADLSTKIFQFIVVKQS